MINIPKGYIKKKGKTIPFGYELSEIKDYLKPIPKQQELLLKNITLEIEQFAIFIFASSKFLLELLVLIGISTYLMFIDPYISLACVFAFVAFGYIFNLFNSE